MDYGTVKIDEDIIGQDAREVVMSDVDISTKIAVLDSVFAVFDKKPTAAYFIDGPASEKTIRRASIVTNEVIKVLFRVNAKKVLNIGVMGNFIKLLQDRKIISASLLAPSVMYNGKYLDYRIDITKLLI